MSDGFVLDANIIHHWYKQWTKGQGELYDLVEYISENHGLAVDDKDKMISEWRDQTDAVVLDEWIAGEMASDRLRMVRTRSLQEENHMRDSYGLDVQGKDIVYIRCAHATRVRHILSRDVDLYEPTAKANATRRAVAMEQRTGKLCRYMQKKLGIVVCTASACPDSASCDVELCPARLANMP